MRRQHLNFKDEHGNAVLEFVFVFSLATAFLLSSALEIELQVRDHFAALSIANETMRTLQLNNNPQSADVAARSAARVFGLDSKLVSINIISACGSSNRFEIEARVRQVSEVAKANC